MPPPYIPISNVGHGTISIWHPKLLYFTYWHPQCKTDWVHSIWSPCAIDEYMDINYMVKSQSSIESIAQGELKSSLFVNPVWSAGVGLTKTDTQATNGLCFRRSRYRWKSKELRFLTQLVPHQYTVGSYQNRHSKMMSESARNQWRLFLGLKSLYVLGLLGHPLDHHMSWWWLQFKWGEWWGHHSHINNAWTDNSSTCTKGESPGSF
jgi:hypothetical protein